MSSNLPLLVLEAITEYFVESGSVFNKTLDDLRHELSFQNDWHCNEFPDIATEEVSLLQLLQASAERMGSSGENAVYIHIHHRIEEAFLEQEMHRSINKLWPQTQSNDVTLAHLALMETAVSGHVGQHGTEMFQAFSERVRQRIENNQSTWTI